MTSVDMKMIGGGPRSIKSIKLPKFLYNLSRDDRVVEFDFLIENGSKSIYRRKKLECDKYSA